FSSGQRSAVSVRDRVVRLSSARWAALRAVAAAVEPRGDVTHVFGAIDEWHLLRAVGRRPVVFTVALPGGALDSKLAQKVSMFAAETEPLAGALIEAGVPADRVAVVYPGVNLQHFCPEPEILVPTDGRFRLLFASTPADPAEFSRRGIPFLVELARARPEVDIVLLVRGAGGRGRLLPERLGRSGRRAGCGAPQLRQHGWRRAHAGCPSFRRRSVSVAVLRAVRTVGEGGLA